MFTKNVFRDCLALCLILNLALLQEQIASAQMTAKLMGSFKNYSILPFDVCHYGDPYARDCLRDEVNITVEGLKGAFCSPRCGSDG